jgi:anti-anti-sigma factor
MLHIGIENVGNNLILHCRGRIVRGEEERILCAAVRNAGRNIGLDLSGVETIDAAGVGALIALQAAGIYMRLLEPTAAVREVLRLTKLDTVLEICSSSVEAESETTNWQTARVSLPLPSPAI